MTRPKTVAIAAMAILILASSTQTADPLPSWNDGPAKRAILQFVERVTAKGSADYVEPAERIAVFDNDGTLWAEQPMPFQFLFMLDRLKALAPQHPEWKTEEPFASVLKGDVKAAFAGGAVAIGELMMATSAGMTIDEYEGIVRDWIATATHPTKGRLYTELAYRPMLELLGFLRLNAFKTFIVSGGDVDFMRPWADRVYGIPPEHVIGSAVKTRFELRGGTPVIVRRPEIDFIDDGPGKPIGIERHIGRRPLAAFGNSDGDLQMLQWTAAGSGPRLCLYVHHTDAIREWAYDREFAISRFDTGLDEARARGWIVVDMKADWKRVFAFEK